MSLLSHPLYKMSLIIHAPSHSALPCWGSTSLLPSQIKPQPMAYSSVRISPHDASSDEGQPAANACSCFHTSSHNWWLAALSRFHHMLHPQMKDNQQQVCFTCKALYIVQWCNRQQGVIIYLCHRYGNWLGCHLYLKPWQFAWRCKLSLIVTRALCKPS